MRVSLTNAVSRRASRPAGRCVYARDPVPIPAYTRAPVRSLTTTTTTAGRESRRPVHGDDNYKIPFRTFGTPGRGRLITGYGRCVGARGERRRRPRRPSYTAVVVAVVVVAKVAVVVVVVVVVVVGCVYARSRSLARPWRRPGTGSLLRPSETGEGELVSATIVFVYSARAYGSRDQDRPSFPEKTTLSFRSRAYRFLLFFSRFRRFRLLSTGTLVVDGGQTRFPTRTFRIAGGDSGATDVRTGLSRRKRFLSPTTRRDGRAQQRLRSIGA